MIASAVKTGPRPVIAPSCFSSSELLLGLAFRIPRERIARTRRDRHQKWPWRRDTGLGLARLQRHRDLGRHHDDQLGIVAVKFLALEQVSQNGQAGQYGNLVQSFGHLFIEKEGYIE